MQQDEVDVLFQAKKLSNSRKGSDDEGGPTVLMFDIILEENIFGVPVSAMPLVMTAMTAVMVRFFFPWLLMKSGFILFYTTNSDVFTYLQLCAALLPWWAGAATPAAVGWLSRKKKRNEAP